MNIFMGCFTCGYFNVLWGCYYREYDWWIERFHNVLSAIYSTKLGKYIVLMDGTLCIFL